MLGDPVPSPTHPRTTEPGSAGELVGSLDALVVGVVAARSACSSLSCHSEVTTREARLPPKISQSTRLKGNRYCIIKCGRRNARKKKRRHPPLWPPQSPWLRLFTTVCLYSAATCFAPSFLAYYSDFTMLVWIMWIFTLCFDWNSGTWFRKWREGGGCTLWASSLITSLQVGGFICWTGFDSIHPPHAFAQAPKGGSILWRTLLKLSWINIFFWGKSKVV